MMLQNKLDRAMNWLKEKNANPNAEYEAQENNDIELEKLDIIALILSALMVFGPILLALLIILVFLLKI